MKKTPRRVSSQTSIVASFFISIGGVYILFEKLFGSVDDLHDQMMEDYIADEAGIEGFV